MSSATSTHSSHQSCQGQGSCDVSDVHVFLGCIIIRSGTAKQLALELGMTDGRTVFFLPGKPKQLKSMPHTAKWIKVTHTGNTTHTFILNLS